MSPETGKLLLVRAFFIIMAEELENGSTEVVADTGTEEVAVEETVAEDIQTVEVEGEVANSEEEVEVKEYDINEEKKL